MQHYFNSYQCTVAVVNSTQWWQYWHEKLYEHVCLKNDKETLLHSYLAQIMLNILNIIFLVDISSRAALVILKNINIKIGLLLPVWLDEFRTVMFAPVVLSGRIGVLRSFWWRTLHLTMQLARLSLPSIFNWFKTTPSMEAVYYTSLISCHV